MLSKYYKKYNKKKNPVILDIGCGISPVSPDYTKTIFIEADKGAVEMLKKQKYNAIIGDVEKVPLKKSFADAIFSSEVLEHVPNYKKGLKEFYRVLKKDGLLFITVPTHMKYWAFDDDYVGHLRRFNPDKIAAEIRSEGFEILENKPIGSLIERELTKLFVRMALRNKDNGKIGRFKMEIFKILNKTLFGVIYLNYWINNKNNSSIVLLVARKK